MTCLFLFISRSELAKPANSLYLHNLTGVLETAIRATNAQFDDTDILNRLDVRLLQVIIKNDYAYSYLLYFNSPALL